jgi:hypothetical protein
VTPATSQPALGCPGGTSIGFELDLVSSSGGSPTPIKAAVAFATRGLPGWALPKSGWVEVAHGSADAVVESDGYQVHVTEGPDGSWQVDSGTYCE